MSVAQAIRSAPAGQPTTLGRYRVIGELERSLEGCVFLAEDPQLQRQVVIKTVEPGRDEERKAALLSAARTTAKLQHANIVTLYDVFDDDSVLCLVFEYVPGDTLERVLRNEGRLEATRAASITLQILDGLCYAHERAIAHLDIKPASVLIDPAGNARIMDFGIATATAAGVVCARSVGAGDRVPETVDPNAAARCNDVFSVGMTLYELLTGQRAMEGNDVFDALHDAANASFDPPSALNDGVDDALDHIVMRSISVNPAARYADAPQMRHALDQYLHPTSEQASTGQVATEKGGAVEFLLTRIRHKSTFPALSRTISAINRLTSGHEQSVQALSDVLLKDFSLTNKLLRIVNSSGYGQFGGTVSTISRAVMIIGYDAIRDIAITLVLFEHLQNKGQASKLLDDVAQSLFTGIVARRIARSAGVRDAEEGFICGVFRHLGRLLASFYLYEESVEVGRRMQLDAMSEEAASRAVLGASYEEIGIAVARSWNLPPGIVASMRQVGEDHPRKAPPGPERLRLVASLADAIAQAATVESATEREAQFKRLARRYGDVVDLDARQMGKVAAEASRELLEDTAALLGDGRKSRFCQSLRLAAGDVTANAQQGDALEHLLGQTGRGSTRELQASGEGNAAQVLAAGIQDITNTLVDDFDLNDLLRIILETMYRGIGFSRVMLFLRSPTGHSMTARFGYGADMDRLLARLQMPYGSEQDVFSVALAKRVDVLISDIDAPNIQSRIPEWFRSSTLGRTFVLLPLVIDNKAIGLFYGDKSAAGELTIEQAEMNLLKTLRNQAVLALRQRREGPRQ